MRRNLWLVVLVVGANLALSAAQQVHVFNGLAYRFPASYAAGLLSVSNQATGALAWVGGPALAEWPPDLVVASPTGSCPTGWTEYTALRGRSPVGLVASGTNGADVGTALTNTENRPVGTHGHSFTDPGHSHAQSAHTHSVGGTHGHAIWGVTTFAFDGDTGPGDPINITSPAGTTSSSTSTTGVTIDNATGVNAAAASGVTVNIAGAVAGTNAPYVQLMFCRTPA